MTDTAPLTPEEERRLRAATNAGRGYDGGRPEWNARLLATLDQVRAESTPSGLPNERWVRREEHVRTPEGPDDYCTGCGDLWPCPFVQGFDAAADTPSLDVERIADAFHDALCTTSHHDSREVYAAASGGETQPTMEGSLHSDRSRPDWARIASRILAEYARLRDSQPDRGEGAET